MLFTGLLGLMITSCNGADNIENRGYVTKFSDFSKIKAGESTKSDVIQALGSPSTTSLYGNETWFYIGKEQTKETFFAPEVKSYDAYQITFNKAGVVTAIDKKDKNSLKEFDIAKDYTKTSGNEITFWQQLFGNLGKFNPAGQATGPKTGVTPGGQKPRNY